MEGRGKKILVVDDDHLSMKMTEQILKGFSFEVLTANSGESCLDVLRRSQVDLVLLDVEMPGLNGLDTLRLIRAEEKIRSTKVVFLTGTIDGERKRIVQSLGALDFIQKPILPVSLVEQISKVFRETSRQCVLVVDDDNMNLRFAQRMLGSYYDVSCVSSGKAALEYLKTSTPALALLDLHMPEMNGFQLLEQIRLLPDGDKLPVVFLTADNDRETEIQVFKAGALDYIQKPFVADVLLHRLNRILDLKRLQDSLRKKWKSVLRN